MINKDDNIVYPVYARPVSKSGGVQESLFRLRIENEVQLKIAEREYKRSGYTGIVLSVCEDPQPQAEEDHYAN